MSGIELSPAWTLIFGAALVPLLRGTARSLWVVALPLAGLAQLWLLAPGEYGQISFLGEQLLLVRVDRWSRLFGFAFLIAALVSAVYSLHLRDAVQQTAGLSYAGAAIGAVFAGDLLTLFVFWELTAVTSVFLIWARGTPRAWRAGMRYLLVQLVSGMLLLFGALQQLAATGSLRFGELGLDAPGGLFIFLAFGIKCAFPLLHNWLQDAYPEATVTGTVFLSAFTTKMAVYALARGYAGTPELVWIGATMALFPVFHALAESNLRRILAYSMNSQLGFMVVGVGIGTELALNGAAAHAVGSILYTSLLFMATGAVCHRTGRDDATQAGAGLYRSMPRTALLCLVGAASIASLPLSVGFVSKSMILSAAGAAGHPLAWLALMLAAVGAILHTGIRLPLLAFFSRGTGERGGEAPAGMLVAMTIAAALCVGIGVYPAVLYALLPYPVDYVPYTGSHVLTQLQLIAFSALAFALLMRAGIQPPALKQVLLDSDWLYRRAAPRLAAALLAGTVSVRQAATALVLRPMRGAGAWLQAHHGPEGLLARTWTTGGMALWAAILLAAYLVAYYV